MKKMIEIKVKNKMIYDRGFTIIIGKLMKDFGNELENGTAFIDWDDWTHEKQATIRVTVIGEPKVIEEITKRSLRERMSLFTMKPFVSIEVKDCE